MSNRDSKLVEKLSRGETVDVRGDGKAGGGLVLVIQALGSSLAHANLDAQDWPLFSSARKGANVRAYLRVAQGRVDMTCQVTRPDVAILMNEAAAEGTDFAEGTNGAIYVINSASSPEEARARYRLGGLVATVAGDAIAIKYLGRPLGNIAVFAAVVNATGLVLPQVARDSLHHALEKRRLPQRIVEANLSLFDHALEHVHMGSFPATPETDHVRSSFAGYGRLPVGAQAALRTSRASRTAGYGRPGVRTVFRDPTSRCNGCSLCVVQCPEGIIEFNPDPSRGTIVTGALFTDYCKVCRECVAACPLDLFAEEQVVCRPEGAISEGA